MGGNSSSSFSATYNQNTQDISNSFNDTTTENNIQNIFTQSISSALNSNSSKINTLIQAVNSLSIRQNPDTSGCQADSSSTISLSNISQANQMTLTVAQDQKATMTSNVTNDIKIALSNAVDLQTNNTNTAAVGTQLGAVTGQATQSAQAITQQAAMMVRTAAAGCGVANSTSDVSYSTSITRLSFTNDTNLVTTINNILNQTTLFNDSICNTLILDYVAALTLTNATDISSGACRQFVTINGLAQQNMATATMSFVQNSTVVRTMVSGLSNNLTQAMSKITTNNTNFNSTADITSFAATMKALLGPITAGIAVVTIGMIIFAIIVIGFILFFIIKKYVLTGGDETTALKYYIR